MIGVTMIRFRLEELLKARDWTDYRFAQESGIGAAVIGKYRRNLVRQPDLKVLSKMCTTLECEIGDLMEYVPDKGKPKPSPRSKKRRK
ncbi:MAG: helix-turn-helix transcriptional regulator [Pyrinomonadaceae bacterium]|nr:helix-turn-helix transcriptional regulator [Pyrinomonadaceae bacterium]